MPTKKNSDIPQPPYEANLPPRFRNTPFEELPPTLKQKVLNSIEASGNEVK